MAARDPSSPRSLNWARHCAAVESCEVCLGKLQTQLRIEHVRTSTGRSAGLTCMSSSESELDIPCRCNRHGLAYVALSHIGANQLLALAHQGNSYATRRHARLQSALAGCGEVHWIAERRAHLRRPWRSGTQTFLPLALPDPVAP